MGFGELDLEIAVSREAMMSRTSIQLIVALTAAVALCPGTVSAQSGGSAGGGSSGGSSSAAGSRGSGSAGAPAPRVGAGAGTAASNPTLRSDPGSSTSTGVPANSDPRSLNNQAGPTAAPGSTAPGTFSAGSAPAPAGTTTPSGTAYPSGNALEAARQRALRSPPGTAIPPAAAGVGGDRSSTSEVGSDSTATDPATPGLPNQADPNRSTSGDPNRLAGGGQSKREGAKGANMQECEAAWDEKTHMSKTKWRETCARTLTDPHM